MSISYSSFREVVGWVTPPPKPSPLPMYSRCILWSAMLVEDPGTGGEVDIF